MRNGQALLESANRHRSTDVKVIRQSLDRFDQFVTVNLEAPPLDVDEFGPALNGDHATFCNQVSRAFPAVVVRIGVNYDVAGWTAGQHPAWKPRLLLQ